MFHFGSMLVPLGKFWFHFRSIFVPSSPGGRRRVGLLGTKMERKWNQNLASGTKMEPKWNINIKIIQASS